MLATTEDPVLRRRIQSQLLTTLRHAVDLRPRSRQLARSLTDELRADDDADAATLAELAYEHALAGTDHLVVLELRSSRPSRRGAR